MNSQIVPAIRQLYTRQILSIGMLMLAIFDLDWVSEFIYRRVDQSIASMVWNRELHSTVSF